MKTFLLSLMFLTSLLAWGHGGDSHANDGEPEETCPLDKERNHLGMCVVKPQGAGLPCPPNSFRNGTQCERRRMSCTGNMIMVRFAGCIDRAPNLPVCEGTAVLSGNRCVDGLPLQQGGRPTQTDETTLRQVVLPPGSIDPASGGDDGAAGGGEEEEDGDEERPEPITATSCTTSALPKFDGTRCVAECPAGRPIPAGQTTNVCPAATEASCQAAGNRFLEGTNCVERCTTGQPTGRRCSTAATASTSTTLQLDTSGGSTFASCKWVDDLPRRVHTIQRACGAGRNKEVCVGFVVCRKANQAAGTPDFIRSSTCSKEKCVSGDANALACTREPGFFSAAGPDLEEDARLPSERVRQFLGGARRE